MTPVFIVIILLIAALLIVGQILRIKGLREENQIMELYVQTMDEFYKGISERMNAMRRYHHDIAKHIQILEALSERGSNTEQIQGFAEELKQQCVQMEKKSICEDYMINTILSLKKEMCDEKQIPFYVTVENGRYNYVEEADMVGLLYNLLDNAIEANENVEEGHRKGIWFEMKREDDNILIHMRNHTKAGVKLSFKTTKKQKEEHGIGTKIIYNILEKYDGKRQTVLDEEHWIFEDTISIPVKKVV